MGLATADLHQGPGTRHVAGDGLGKAVRRGGIAVFVTKFRANPPGARPASASSNSPISRRCSNTCTASFSSITVRAKPTWTSTYSPICASGTKARLISLTMLPKSTRPTRVIGSSPARLRIHPGTAKHTSLLQIFPSTRPTRPDRVPARRHWAEYAGARPPRDAPHVTRNGALGEAGVLEAASRQYHGPFTGARCDVSDRCCHQAIMQRRGDLRRRHAGQEDGHEARSHQAGKSVVSYNQPFCSIYRGAYFERVAPLLAWTCKTCSPPTCAACATRRGFRRTISPTRRKLAGAI